MKITIHLEKNDIETQIIGSHFQIETPTVAINFTPEALEEFFNDAKQFRNHNIREKIQKDYSQITNFGIDWITPLAEKYKITREDVLEIVNL